MGNIHACLVGCIVWPTMVLCQSGVHWKMYCVPGTVKFVMYYINFDSERECAFTCMHAWHVLLLSKMLLRATTSTVLTSHNFTKPY